MDGERLPSALFLGRSLAEPQIPEKPGGWTGGQILPSLAPPWCPRAWGFLRQRVSAPSWEPAARPQALRSVNSQ